MKQLRPGQAPGLPPASEMKWTQKALANCYFYSPLPEFMRRMRAQYRLAVSSGGWPKMALRKRTGPSARILYYHRVNDENDPFLPAISTRLFEQQMRFVSRHYTVVTVTELLERLKDRTTEPIVAITFDDGYQDNFHNALPILERYRLPATIFLTTGSMDSRAPLWFEELAEAFKKTREDFIDLEIGDPQRLPTRTIEERLQSNGRTFALLRALSDTERRVWLSRILQKLRYSGPGELRDRMLTWEQARLMRRRGIDFGGHTVTHPFLSRTLPEQGIWEVAECKRRIEGELQDPVSVFAYPNGRKEDFSDSTKQALRQAGYGAAVTTVWGINDHSTDPMELRRGGPWEPSAAQFAYKLDWYTLVND